MESIILGGGCFWCTEAVFLRLRGVERVEPGYTGGRTTDPTYDEVCGGGTGHAEVVRVTFDPRLLSVRELLTVFFFTHDPTTLNRQGADIGTQYRSAVFYGSEAQAQAAREVKAALEREGEWKGRPFVTEIAPASEFFPAEEYHQDYYRRNANQPYCQFVTRPKLEKLQELFKDRVK